MKRRSNFSGDDYWLRFVDLLKKRVRFKGEEGGFYIFEDGRISQFLIPEVEDGKVRVPFRFSTQRPKFLDEIFMASTEEFGYCDLSCSLRGNVDFERLRSWTKNFGLAWLGETEETFSCILDVGGQILKLTAYPSRGMLNLLGTLRKDSREPSGILRAIFQEEPMAVISVRIPLCYRESCLKMAELQGLSLSDVQRNALKMCLERFYRREIKKLMKL
ncbi:hypothetical protein DRO64_04580 [Candidatus Bathyarchaeota archaeon]|nr:MAG: hypothetical protein DRO64_04580 [Candidatus Bathyarchaeota archaeon]HDD56434.1 hypothetical protein [Nitrososphaeria archaeon]